MVLPVQLIWLHMLQRAQLQQQQQQQPGEGSRRMPHHLQPRPAAAQQPGSRRAADAAAAGLVSHSKAQRAVLQGWTRLQAAGREQPLLLLCSSC